MRPQTSSSTLHPPPTPNSGPLTTSHAARAIGVSEGSVRHMAAKGELPFVRTASGLRLFDVQDVRRVRKARTLTGTHDRHTGARS